MESRREFYDGRTVSEAKEVRSCLHVAKLTFIRQRALIIMNAVGCMQFLEDMIISSSAVIRCVT